MFYDPDSDAVTRFRGWEAAWTAGGWTPRILTKRMAMHGARNRLYNVGPENRAWMALLTTIGEACLLCDSLDCRPTDAAGVHEVPDKAAIEVRC